MKRSVDLEMAGGDVFPEDFNDTPSLTVTPAPSLIITPPTVSIPSEKTTPHRKRFPEGVKRRPRSVESELATQLSAPYCGPKSWLVGALLCIFCPGAGCFVFCCPCDEHTTTLVSPRSRSRSPVRRNSVNVNRRSVSRSSVRSNASCESGSSNVIFR